MTNEILMTGISFSMVPRAEADVVHCRRDMECFLFLKNCPYYRVCSPQHICICIGKKYAPPKVYENTTK
jgi:hypothetical protein